MNRYALSLVLLLCLTSPQLRAQPETRSDPPGKSLPPFAFAFLQRSQDDDRDPGYATYRQGYRLILKQEWPAARKKFQELIARYPRSTYVDEAYYWSAYALKHTDILQAMEAYREFTRVHSASRYFDDAVADFEELKFEFRLLTGDSLRGKLLDIERNLRFSIAPELHRASGRLRVLSAEHARSARAFAGHREDPPDPRMKLKLEALHALARQQGDEEAFRTLRDVARNPSRPEPLRIVALRSLSEFRRFDALPVALEIARTDINPELRTVAVAVISSLGRERENTVDLLAGLYREAPVERVREKDGLLFAIADIGNDRAVDFFSDLAASESDEEIRAIAIYCLGSIGGDRAREALRRIVRAE